MISFIIPLKVNSEYGLNKIYVGVHWAKRNKTAEEIHDLVQMSMMAQRIPRKKFDKPVAIHISYNSGLDIDNHGYLSKLLVDGLKGYLIEDDSRKYVTCLIQDFHSGKDIIVEIWEVN